MVPRSTARYVPLATCVGAGPQGRRQRTVLEGDVPSPINPPSGCHLHLRCPYAVEVCRVERPPLVAEGSHATACHRWRELPPAVSVAREGERSPGIEKLVSLFARGADVAPSPGVDTVTPSLPG